ncbi:MAG: OmpA family protein [Desulfuromonadales bacterium]|nr:OmpA family protein [Desulfuromonadales bacterium]
MARDLIHKLRTARCFALGLTAVVGALVRAVLARVSPFVHPCSDRSAGCCRNCSTRRPLGTSLAGGLQRPALLLLLLWLLLPQLVVAATPPGTRIDNTAILTVTQPGSPATISSNPTSLVTRSPAVLKFLQYAPTVDTAERLPVARTYYDDGSSYLLVPEPAAINSQPVPLIPATLYSASEVLFLRLTDLDQNLDPLQRETVLVTVSADETGDSETLRLSETGPSSGIFSGYLPMTLDGPRGADGSLLVGPENHLSARYSDPVDNSDTSVAAALVDPYGYVFDSTTGERLNGASVTLWDVTANGPAIVFGDDGSSRFPATVVTGSSVTDNGGTSYTFNPGGFRFPFVSPGHYRLMITPPPGYRTPSAVAEATLQTLPGAPFALAIGSRGEEFSVNPGPALRIDIPADPATGGLWIQKQADRTVAAAGDFILYRIQVDNLAATAVASNLRVEDLLPQGFRYQSGSTRIDGVAVADPTVSADGRTLTYSLADLPAAASIEITYVVEVGAGTRPGRFSNIAFAGSGNGLSSNRASADVVIREDLLRSRSLLAGRVMVGECNVPDTQLQGLENVRIYLEDGTYVLTDKDGKYHVEGIEPGTHVVQLDQSTLPPTHELVSCEDNTRFAGRNFSQFVDIQGGTLWRADFHLGLKQKSRGEVRIELDSSLEEGIATFRIPIRISEVPLDDLRLSVLLPEGLAYLPGSSLLAEAPLADPAEGLAVLTYHLGDRPAAWDATVSLKAAVTGQQRGELQTSAVLTFNTPEQRNQRTPMVDSLIKVSHRAAPNRVKFDVRPHYPTRVATFSERDKVFFDQLANELKHYEIDKLFAIGHTDNVPIAAENRIYFADNFALSAARAEHVARYLGAALNLREDKVVSIGIADAAPVADNTTPEGRSINRRVEVRVEGRRIDQKRILELVKAHSGPQVVATVGLREGEQPRAEQQPGHPDTPPTRAPQIDRQWLAAAQPGIRLLWPQPGYVPVTPSTKIMVQHQRGQRVAIRLNGQSVPAVNYAGVESRKDGRVAVSIWRGVDLASGRNRFEITVHDASGQLLQQFEEQIYYAETAYRAELVEARSQLVADSATPPKLVLRLLDINDQPVRPGLFADISVEPPYRPLLPDALTLSGGGRPAAAGERIQTGADGHAELELEPTSRAGRVAVTVHLSSGPQLVETWLTPAPRDWILVGFAEGTAGYNTLSGHQANLDEAGIEDHGYHDGRAKFFAKGAIKGEWLLTMAYDSEKQNRDADSLHQLIDPDSYYPLYGDETRQDYEAASARKIYVRLERNQFYALFGDMQTGLTQTELARYVRSMNGFKAEYQGTNVSYKLFASETRQGFVRDELRGDGTSGRYQLSRPDLVLNSEEVTLETRDRLHSERILSSQALHRHLDYEIDYSDGSLFFKRPIPSRDAQLNPTFIVVRYETRASAESELNYGGRAAVKIPGQPLEIGGTHVHQQSGDGAGELSGVDAKLTLGSHSSLRVEAATTDSEDSAGQGRGDAYLVEFEHSSSNISATVYFRQQDEQFGLGQQNSSESGTRKYGAEGSFRLNRSTALNATLYNQDNLDNSSTREVAELEVDYRNKRFGLFAGFRDARDLLGDNSRHQSQQLLTGGTWATADRKLSLHATHEQSLGSKDENADYPTLTLLGADYRIGKQVSLFAEQEFTWGDERETEGTRAGLKATPWRGSTARTSVERQIEEDSERLFSLFGLGQTWQTAENWSIDATLDRSYTLKDSGSYEFDSAVPATHGSDEDFTAISLGATYQQDGWSWSNRLEIRHADSEDRYGLVSGLVGQVRRGISASARYMGFLTDGSNGTEKSEQELTLGLAYRPIISRWIFLNRLDVELDQDKTSLHDDTSWRLVNNLHANFKLNRDWQIAPYYGLKYLRENFSGRHYAGFTDLAALETRYNLNRQWDFGLHGSVLHTWNSNQYDYSSGVSAGYLFITNLWASIGYNFDGFRDEDFSQANYTAKGVYLKFRLKFDQNTLEDALEWLNRQ